MKTKSILLLIPMLLLCAACTSGKKDNAQPAASTSTNDLTNAVAYVDLDSVQEHYTYFQEEKSTFEQLQKSMQTTAQQKEQALVNLQSSIQKRAQNGQITSETQYKQEVSKYQQQEEAYKKWASQQQEQLASEQERINTALMDSINHFLADYNKTKKFALILNKGISSNFSSVPIVLYARKSMDITNEVIAGLNKRYKK